MKANISQPPTRRSKGAALIITLAFVVLLTGLALAYFSRTTTDRQLAQSSFNDTNADVLARSALNIAASDLNQEIVNGSTGTTVNGITIYSPTPAANMLPQRSGNPAGVPNLIRRSVRSDLIPAPGLPSRASAVNSTTDVSANGRSVTSTRWNSHYLVPKKNVGTDDPVPIDAFTAATPDWVFVTNNGPAVITGPSASVLGRYAYAIYDEGGLIDVNVGGYPSPSPSPATYVQTIGRKGPVAFADLTQLANMSTGGIGDVVGWRNYASVQPAGSLTNFTFDANAASRYLTTVRSNTSGFMTVNGVPWNGRTDQAFLNRQSLIQFRRSSGFTANALQYLGTFSRELNRPSWKPSTPTGSTIDYAALAITPTAENSIAINRDLGRVRVSPPGGFTRADGTQAVVGEPLLKTRFPLVRINELTNTANPNIQRDFGLKWPSPSPSPLNHWDYVGATGSTVQSVIKTLDQVALENREPNFFEILKAVILSGSVGLGSNGATNTFVINEAKYSSADYQIMQIGANIIDAWDSDNVPTFINFGVPGNELAGIENLPYLSKLVFVFWINQQGGGPIRTIPGCYHPCGIHIKMPPRPPQPRTSASR